MALVAGKDVLLAIDRAAGGGEDHAPQPVRARRLHQIQKADQVDLRVEGRIGDRAPHIHLRREMNNDFGPLALDHAAHGSVRRADRPGKSARAG